MYGSLDDYEAYEKYTGALAACEHVRPEVIAVDLHPDYVSTAIGIARGEAEGIPVIGVQHHHAHMAAVLLEHGIDGEAIGVVFDGTGYGLDGTLWGGEFLTGGIRSFRRAAHFAPVPMPGGAAAIREPWRMASSYLQEAGIDALHRATLRTNMPMTSSVGRLFDAVSSLLEIRRTVTFEGEAAMELEAAALLGPESGMYPFDLCGADPIVVATAPLIRAIVADRSRGVPVPVIASRFHTTLASVIRLTCDRIRRQSGLSTVVLSGGVFLNALLLRQSLRMLEEDDFKILLPVRIPISDAGLAAGQLVIALSSI